MRDEGFIYVAGHPLLIGDVPVQDCQGVSASEMTCIALTCIVSSGALNSTHSLTVSVRFEPERTGTPFRFFFRRPERRSGPFQVP